MRVIPTVSWRGAGGYADLSASVFFVVIYTFYFISFFRPPPKSGVTFIGQPAGWLAQGLTAEISRGGPRRNLEDSGR